MTDEEALELARDAYEKQPLLVRVGGKHWIHGYAQALLDSQPKYGPTIFTKVRQECYSCPSSWTAWTADGREYHLRFRYGVGSLKSYEDERGEFIAKFLYGDGYSGFISLEKFIEELGGYAALSEDYETV